MGLYAMLAPVVNHQGDDNEEEDYSRNVIIQPSRKSGHCCRFASGAVGRWPTLDGASSQFYSVDERR